MALLVVAALMALLSFAAWIFIVAHAFRRSVGTGFIVLLVPGYVLWYAFSQFDHPRKSVIVPVFLGAGLIAAMLYGAAGANLAHSRPPL